MLSCRKQFSSKFNNDSYGALLFQVCWLAVGATAVYGAEALPERRTLALEADWLMARVFGREVEGNLERLHFNNILSSKRLPLIALTMTQVDRRLVDHLAARCHQGHPFRRLLVG